MNPPGSIRRDQVLQLFPEQRALGLVFDALRDADVRFLRQVDQQPSGNAHLSGKPRALGADRILDDLHQQLLAVVQDAFDRLGLVLVLAVAPDVGDVQERRAVQPDLDEGRLHSRQHPAYFAEVDVADQAAAADALDVQFLDHALLHHRNPRFLRRDVDQDFFVHSSWKPKWPSRRAVSNIGRPTTPV